MKTLFVLLASALLFVGCETQNDAHKSAAHAVPANLEPPQFIALDSGVQHSLKCNHVQAAPLPDGRLDVAATLQNLENRRIQVQANCVFMDTNNAVVEETGFVNVFLDENAMETVKFASLNDKAQKFTVRVRQAR